MLCSVKRRITVQHSSLSFLERQTRLRALVGGRSWYSYEDNLAEVPKEFDRALRLWRATGDLREPGDESRLLPAGVVEIERAADLLEEVSRITLENHREPRLDIDTLVRNRDSRLRGRCGGLPERWLTILS